MTSNKLSSADGVACFARWRGKHCCTKLVLYGRRGEHCFTMSLCRWRGLFDSAAQTLPSTDGVANTASHTAWIAFKLCSTEGLLCRGFKTNFPRRTALQTLLYNSFLLQTAWRTLLHRRQGPLTIELCSAAGIPLQMVWPAVWGVIALDERCGPVQGDVQGLCNVQFQYSMRSPECFVNWVHDEYTLLF